MEVDVEDRIEKTIVLRAPRSRVWRALTDAGEFGRWFGVEMDGAFAAGRPIRGQITSKGYEHMTMSFTVVAIEPETLFAYTWHPYAVDPSVDYTSETPTRVEFRLQDEDGGTRLTVVESGFAKVPAARRAEAFRMNTGGWIAQLQNIERHVAG